MPARNSFPRSLSLNRQADIRRLFDRGRRLSGKYCSLIWEVGEASQFGIFLSRAHGKAARRNRIRRLYREAVRLNQHLLTRPVRVVVLPHVSSEQPDFSAIHDDIRQQFQRINAATA
ncbi:MAG: ribonuclease P protein component [Candidatus Zixiibacteriota bacterium]